VDDGVTSQRRRVAGALVRDGLLAAGVGGVQLLLLSIAAQNPAPGARPLDLTTVVLVVWQAAPLVARRRWPVTVFVLILVPNTLYYALGFPPSGLDLGLAVALYTVASLRPRWVSLSACAAILVVCTALWLLEVGPYWANATLALFVYLLVFFSAAWAWGRYHRAKQQVRDAYVADLVAAAERSERDRAAEKERAVADERRRIARELHDSVAHHMSVMVVQAGAARRVVDHDVDTTKKALVDIEETGRRGLEIMPSLIHALRGGDVSSCLAPQPTLDDIRQLTRNTRAAGVDVTLSMSLDGRTVPAAVELSAHRIVQEALTNCIKHAPGAAVTVTVQARATDLVVEVADDGAKVPAPTTTESGHGLVGMGERVALFGGELRTGRNALGGFTVRASLPMTEQLR
jgi:signal transduction histidine kinase